ncbi:conserved hypothetical protein, secreted [sediment metagenome]|uniref:Alginate export domain-containing protein n=1 Tax=sediment metagenome TaxID=749907 RepID=D9PEZ8_9ZZZZ
MELKHKLLFKICLIAIFISALFCNLSFAELKTTYGAAFRIRHEFWKDHFDLDNDIKDNRNYFRIKSSIFGSIGEDELDFAEEAVLNLKLTDEFKAYTYLMSTSTPNSDKNKNFNIDEMVVDNLYLDIKGFMDLPLNFRLGRQDFLNTHGEGFLIMDGTPLDGSRTFYFNAAKATWTVNETNSLDAIYLYQPKTDDLLPIINGHNRNTPLATSDEQGYVVYLRNADIENLNFEPYYIFKQEDSGGARLQANSSQINTFGAFAKYKFPEEAITLRGQLAGQFGEYGSADREALGGYIFIDKSFEEEKMSPMISLGYAYLSGDDESTDEREAWDPLFSRYPWMSEILASTYAAESGAGYWTNLQIIKALVSAKPLDKTKLILTYNYLLANEEVTGTYYADGNERGHLYTFKTEYTITKDINTSFLAEYFVPGDFYKESSQDEALFLRTELNIKF